MGIVWFESQKYSFGSRMQFFCRSSRDKTVLGKVRYDERFCQLTYRRNNRLCAQELIQLMTETLGYTSTGLVLRKGCLLT